MEYMSLRSYLDAYPCQGIKVSEYKCRDTDSIGTS